MGLTEEQQARMAANRAQALARRQAGPRLAAPLASATRAPPPIPPRPTPATTPIQGQCLLIASDRFRVVVGFQPQLIQMFKRVPSAAYHAQDRTWHFALDDHDALIALVAGLQPLVRLDPLPAWIIRAFAAAAAPTDRLASLAPCSERLEIGLWAHLMPFQQAGVAFALQRQGRVYIADDMGLGKTIQALGVASAFRTEWPLLVVCPSSVRFAWRDSIIRWLPSISEDDIHVITSGKDWLGSGQATIISYDLMSKKERELKDRQYQVVIMDEAHFLKNNKSQRFQSSQKIVQRSRRLILLSGTPALSRPIELYSQISLLMPKLFPYPTDFGMRYCDGRKVNLGPRGSHYDFNGSSNMAELKILLEQTCMIRRLKSEVLAQLPAKQREMILLDPASIKSKSQEMSAQARKMGSKTLSQGERRGVLLEWFNSTAKAKLKAVQDYIKDLLESERKFICFAHHKIMMDHLAETMDKKNIRYIRIDGHTASEARNKYCEQFQTDDKTQVALLSITAANAGITLTAAQLVVFAELFWNPGVLTQAEDRAHRIGQSDCVTVQYLVAKGTADDELWPLLQKKLDVLNKAGLSKDNFHESNAHQHIAANDDSTEPGAGGTPSKITDYFSNSMSDLDLEQWDPDDSFGLEEESAIPQDPTPEAKKPRLVS